MMTGGVNGASGYPTSRSPDAMTATVLHIDDACIWAGEPVSAELPPQADERPLIEACRGGDRDAFAELVRRHQRRVFRLAARFFSSREDVEDMAQDIFLIAWRRLGTYRGDAPFEHWLTRVSLNACYARLKKVRPTVPVFDRDAEAPDSQPDTRLEVERLLAHLNPDDRFILVLLYGEGWSVAEIAERLGWTAVNVRVRAHRARKKLRSLLERDLPQ